MSTRGMDIGRLKKIEKEHFEQFRDGSGPLPPVDVEEVHRTLLQPCYTTGNDQYSDNKMAFHEWIAQRGDWKGKCVLDYACGNGTWAAYFALTGARKVVGFDLAESGVRRGRERLLAQGLADRVELLVADATNLPFTDNQFELVIGTAVLHHVIKYPNVFPELHRVMQPGAQAFFLEGLADFPLFKLWWGIRGEVDSGDVPIFAAEFRRQAALFSKVEIVGDTFLFSVKRLLWKPNLGRLRRSILRSCKAADRVLFKVCPPLRRWGCFSYIALTK